MGLVYNFRGLVHYCGRKHSSMQAELEKKLRVLHVDPKATEKRSESLCLALASEISKHPQTPHSDTLPPTRPHPFQQSHKYSNKATPLNSATQHELMNLWSPFSFKLSHISTILQNLFPQSHIIFLVDILCCCLKFHDYWLLSLVVFNSWEGCVNFLNQFKTGNIELIASMESSFHERFLIPGEIVWLYIVFKTGSHCIVLAILEFTM